MSDYYLHAIILEGCPYSNAALELLNEHKNIKTQIIKHKSHLSAASYLYPRSGGVAQNRIALFSRI